MKTLIGIVFIVAAVMPAKSQDSRSTGGDQHPAFKGYLLDGTQLYARFADPSAKSQSKWIAPGDSIAGYLFTGLNETRTAAILIKDGKQVTANLQVPSVKTPGGTDLPADSKLNVAMVEKIFEQMQLDQFIEKTMSKQREILGTQLDQLKRATGQKKEVSEAIDKALSWGAIKGDLITIYSSNYTAEELSGISEFYSSPVGRALIAKQEKVSTDTMMVLQKRIQAATLAISNTTK